MLLIAPPGKNLSKAITGGSLKETESVLPGLRCRLPRLRPISPAVCVFPRSVPLVTLARKGIGFLCLMQADRKRSAQVCPTWDKHRAIRPCGPNGVVIVVHIVAIRIHAAVVIHIRRVVIIVAGGAQPPAADFLFYNPIPYMMKAFRLTPPIASCRCLSMRRAYFDSHALSL